MHPHLKSAYTLAEVLFTVTAISLTAAGLLEGLANINDFATANRLNTCATAIVEDQIDRALRETPFTPSSNPPSIPQGLTSGTTTVPIYTDPVTNSTMVTGTLAVTVSGTSVPVTTGSAAPAVTVYKVRASVNYHYHAKNYSVTMSTLRSVDPS